jgi:hypothetical protein
VTDQKSPPAGFSRLRQAARKREPLSFATLSASLEQAQAETGFVDTLGVELAPSGSAPTESRTAEGAAAHNLPTQPPAPDPPPAPAVGPPMAGSMPPDLANQRPEVIAEEPPTSAPMRRRGRVRAPFVQCNLKLGEDLRDALHLQALRERRSVADLVTEVMTAYLSAKGTFERLR